MSYCAWVKEEIHRKRVNKSRIDNVKNIYISFIYFSQETKTDMGFTV